MKVLGINGSPRKGGNTDILLDKLMEGAKSEGAKTEKIVLNDLEFSPVQEDEYEKVNNDGLSVIEDDMQLVYRKIKEADTVVLASPIFFGSLSAQTKMMIDRFQCVWLAKNFKKMKIFTAEKRGVFLCVEASTRGDFFDNAKSIVKNFFATINAYYEGELFCPGIDKRGSILNRQDYLDQAFKLGKKIVKK